MDRAGSRCGSGLATRYPCGGRAWLAWGCSRSQRVRVVRASPWPDLPLWAIPGEGAKGIARARARAWAEAADARAWCRTRPDPAFHQSSSAHFLWSAMAAGPRTISVHPADCGHRLWRHQDGIDRNRTRRRRWRRPAIQYRQLIANFGQIGIALRGNRAQHPVNDRGEDRRYGRIHFGEGLRRSGEFRGELIGPGFRRIGRVAGEREVSDGPQSILIGGRRGLPGLAINSGAAYSSTFSIATVAESVSSSDSPAARFSASIAPAPCSSKSGSPSDPRMMACGVIVPWATLSR